VPKQGKVHISQDLALFKDCLVSMQACLHYVITHTKIKKDSALGIATVSE